MPRSRARRAGGPAARLVEAALYHLLRGMARAMGALPPRWVLAFADAVGSLQYLLHARARRVGRENLGVFFRDGLDPATRRRILRASMREGARALAVTLHAAPLTPERFRAWVDVPPEVENLLRDAARRVRGAVVVSAHLGNWEILLGLAGLFRDLLPLRFLAEATFHPALDRFLAYLRGTGTGESASREGGALALRSHLARGGLAGIVVDLTVRRCRGGIYAPFAGLAAGTTPLPAWLARKHDVPIAPLFCLPRGDGRYRIHLGPEVSLSVRSDDLDADVLEITSRLNRLVEEQIREHPTAWTWSLKRFKSRPTRERAGHPVYSVHDP